MKMVNKAAFNISTIIPTPQLSDSIKKAFHNFDFSISDCVALEYSFFLSCFICVLAAVFYLTAAEYIVVARADATEQVRAAGIWDFLHLLLDLH